MDLPFEISASKDALFQSEDTSQAQYLPIEIWQEILEYSDFLSQIRLPQACKYFHENLIIYDFYDIDPKYIKKLTDNILKNYKHITKLNLSYNQYVTNEGIKNLKLYKLNASWSQITAEGIKHMKLHTLIIMATPQITDEGIKHMNLHTLNATNNLAITDTGLKHMNLHTLVAAFSFGITDDGVKHMNLNTLDTSNNQNITVKGIKDMNLHTLYATNNDNITYEDVKHMTNLEEFNGRIIKN